MAAFVSPHFGPAFCSAAFPTSDIILTMLLLKNKSNFDLKKLLFFQLNHLPKFSTSKRALS
jgi:hypothetical protein